ncbi:phage protein NinX family protein [Burkholderia vietnamiensis]|uniref:phage protein NinX family protein n=1 Tax=Burkholderia vietnamiensis TaxID=60552 RepID=UPI001BA25D5B|nr:phage protein NinX family protein [Burkholderia vietnamiensis]MBR8030807.1 DUF2591 family protein [Burkholderia vietnamiensis]
MKVSELEGPLLDFWVARAEGNLAQGSTSPENAIVEHYGFGGEIDGRSPLSSWAPSTEWDSGGSIIERERIIAIPYREGGWGAAYEFDPDARGGCFYMSTSQEGETLLIAAMRAYVASKFGDEVPDEK